MQQITRREISSLTASLSNYLAANSHHTKNEYAVIEEFFDSIRNINVESINFFKQFGTDPSHIIRNVIDYRQGLNFGFQDFSIGEYGWINMPDFINVEEISFKVKKDNACYNAIRVASSPSLVWTYAYSFQFGGAGSSSPISVYGEQFSSKQECCIAALVYMSGRFENALIKSDACNYPRAYCTTILSLCKFKLIEYTAGCKVDKKGQCLLF